MSNSERIQNPELAEEMARASKSDRDMAAEDRAKAKDERGKSRAEYWLTKGSEWSADARAEDKEEVAAFVHELRDKSSQDRQVILQSQSSELEDLRTQYQEAVEKAGWNFEKDHEAGVRAKELSRKIEVIGKKIEAIQGNE